MRVIAGTARSLPLKTIDGLDTRPTTDRIKETLFNMLQPEISGCRFLDLFSGSGAIGIEALSRGAKEAVFVEQNKKAANCIRENLSFTKLADHAVVMESDVLTALFRLGNKDEVMDIIFMDPPYGQELEKKALEALADSALVDTYTKIIVEADLQTDFSYVKELGFAITKVKRYKTNQHIFIMKQD